jgi:hypothetical protein
LPRTNHCRSTPESHRGHSKTILVALKSARRWGTFPPPAHLAHGLLCQAYTLC